MPLMDWDAFFEGHHRPFMVHAEQGVTRVRLDALERFISPIGLTGNFAFYRGDDVFRAVFELEADAARIARILGAQSVGRGDEWAGQWLLSPDWATAERATAQTSTSRRSLSPRNATKQRLRRRWHQLPVSQWTLSMGQSAGR